MPPGLSTAKKALNIAASLPAITQLWALRKVSTTSAEAGAPSTGAAGSTSTTAGVPNTAGWSAKRARSLSLALAVLSPGLPGRGTTAVLWPDSRSRGSSTSAYQPPPGQISMTASPGLTPKNASVSRGCL